MKTINTRGITYLEKLDGCEHWYWGTDYIHGDLYEAEELYNSKHEIKSNTLLFVSYPHGEVVEPIKPRSGQYFGRPIYCDGHICMLLVDFKARQIKVEQYDDRSAALTSAACVPLEEVRDCYNLLLHTAPLMLTRQGGESEFEIVYPDKLRFALSEHESFCYRQGNKLFFSTWYEDDDYREEVVVRDIADGRIIERMPGAVTVMPNGQPWLLV